MGVLVLRDREILAQATAGLRDSSKTEQITIDNQFHLGSCTKAMTATLVGLSVQRGEINLDKTLEELLPDWDLHDDFKPVTVKMLLEHRSGLKANTSIFDVLFRTTPEDDAEKIKQRADILKPILKSPPEYPPGEKSAYSNLGYILLGHLLERQSGKAWETLMREQIFEPLEMTSAGFGPPDPGKDVSQPYGHTKNLLGKQTAVIADNPPFLGPAGTVHANLEDWSKFIAVHLGGPNPIGLTQETLDLLHTPGPKRFAAGWIVFEVPDEPIVLFHNGSNTMWYCAVCLVPERGEAVLVTSNVFDQKAVHGVLLKLLSVPIELSP